MQGPVVYSNLPPTQQPQQRMPGHVLNRLVYFVLPIVMVVLVGASMFWLQWASQRGVALGYPTPHVAMFTSADNNNDTVQIRNAIQFTANSPGRGLTYSWDFGDNTGGTGTAVSHNYVSGGSYTVTVTATDDLNQSSTARQTVTVTVPAPQASFTAQNDGNGYYTFDASGSSADPSTTISTYNWDFGDQSNDPNGGQQENHYYYYTGTYTVTLTVTDALGQSSSQYSQTITE